MTRPLQTVSRSMTLLALAAFGLAACGEPTTERSETIVATDSAGVRVVTLAGDPRSLPALRVADTVTLSGTSEDFFNGNPQIAYALRDGRLILTDGRSRAVFGVDGAFSGEFTRFGQGPGELGALSNLWQTTGDSIWAFDGSNRRLSLFAPSLEFARSVQQGGSGMERGFSIWAGVSGDTTAVLEMSPADRTQSAGKRTSNVRLGLWVIGSDAPVISLERPFSEFFMLGGVEGPGVMMLSAPMGASAQWKPLGRCMVYGYSNRWEFAIQEPDDSLRLRDVGLLRAPGDPADAVTPELRERFIAGMMKAYGSQSQAQFEPIYRNQLTYPDSTPHFSRVFSSRDGALWVQRFRGPTTDVPDHWTVVDLATPRAWRLEVPAGSRVLAVDVGRVLIATKDVDELESHHWWMLPELAGIQAPPSCRASN